jgi:hypothetical protein
MARSTLARHTTSPVTLDTRHLRFDMAGACISPGTLTAFTFPSKPPKGQPNLTPTASIRVFMAQRDSTEPHRHSRCLLHHIHRHPLCIPSGSSLKFPAFGPPGVLVRPKKTCPCSCYRLTEWYFSRHRILQSLVGRRRSGQPPHRRSLAPWRFGQRAPCTLVQSQCLLRAVSLEVEALGYVCRLPRLLGHVWSGLA